RDRPVGIDVPRMEEIRGSVTRGKELLVGQAGAVVLRGEPGDLERGVERFAQRPEAEVAAASVTPTLADVDRDAEGPVARLLDRLDLALADIDVQTAVLGELDHRVGGADRTRVAQGLVGQFPELFLGVLEHGHSAWDSAL